MSDDTTKLDKEYDKEMQRLKQLRESMQYMSQNKKNQQTDRRER